MHFKIGSAALAAALFLIVGPASAFAAQSSSSSSTDTHVSIDNYAFKAPTVTIPAGTAVVWTNKDDDPHTVTADDGSFDSKGLGQGDTYRHVFTKPGTYPYHCSAHPYMKGTVIVQGGN
ncbi:MAG: cupredoxin family copper-binding protein [Candidatus Eremiobacteraeota bacterium]|nr:cupredoxin family copper-binding protein [Candidatus Eremiobacteraeota bacterium]MBV8281944.1 cupredoxin family copper-binding protein [Candidatus Eremiobacteraeota bacterium]